MSRSVQTANRSHDYNPIIINMPTRANRAERERNMIQVNVERKIEILTEARQNRPQLVEAAINAINYALAEYVNPQDKYSYKYNYHENDNYLRDKSSIFKAAMSLLKFLTLEELSEVFSEPHCDASEMLQILKNSHEFEYVFDVPGIEAPTLLLWATCNIVNDRQDSNNFRLLRFFINYCDGVDYETTRTGCESELSTYHYFYKLPHMWEIKCVDTSGMDWENKKTLHTLYSCHPLFEDTVHVNQRHKKWCAVRIGDPFEIFAGFAIRSEDEEGDEPNVPK